MSANSLGYEFLGPAQPLGILILFTGILFTAMIFFVFINVSQDKDSVADKKAKELITLEQARKIARLYPKKKWLENILDSCFCFNFVLTMRFFITRNDGKEDEVTMQEFTNYDDAYDLLEEIYGDICCSDADYDERPYYEIKQEEL